MIGRRRPQPSGQAGQPRRRDGADPGGRRRVQTRSPDPEPMSRRSHPEPRQGRRTPRSPSPPTTPEPSPAQAVAAPEPSRSPRQSSPSRSRSTRRSPRPSRSPAGGRSRRGARAGAGPAQPSLTRADAARADRPTTPRRPRPCRWPHPNTRLHPRPTQPTRQRRSSHHSARPEPHSHLGSPPMAEPETVALVALLRIGRRPWPIYAEFVESNGSAQDVLERVLSEGDSGQSSLLPATDPEQLLDRSRRRHRRVADRGHPPADGPRREYPANLRTVHDRPPAVVRRRIDRRPTDTSSLAVIGSRTPSAAGDRARATQSPATSPTTATPSSRDSRPGSTPPLTQPLSPATHGRSPSSVPG